MDDYLTYYRVYTENDVAGADENGLVFKDGYQVRFEDCLRNYASRNPAGSGTCIGERDITDYTFVLYDNHHPVKIRFLRRRFFGELFGKPIHQRFHELQKSILKSGYATFDMS